MAGGTSHITESRPTPEDVGQGEETRKLTAAAFLLAMGVLVLGCAVGASLLLRGPMEQDRSISKLEILQRLVRENPADTASRRKLAMAYEEAGEYKKALHEYEIVLTSSPRDMDALYAAGVLHLRAGDKGKGVADLTAVLKIAPTHGMAAETLAGYFAGERKYGLMRKVALPAATAHPEMADLQYLAGVALEKTGDTKGALVRYRRALSMVPDMAQAREAVRRLAVAK